MKLRWVLLNFGLKLFFILFYFGKWGKNDIIYRIEKKAKFRLRVNTSDKLTVFEVWKSKEYIDSEFGIKKGDIVVDIGANIGAFSVYAAKKASNGHVFAYEPDKENYSMVLKNKSLNNIDNLFLFNLAISAKKGTIDLCTSRLNKGAHSIYEADSKKKIKVETITLKDILTANKIKRVNYLKIDVEGTEYNILLNTPPEVIKKVDKIVLEYHDFLNHTYSYLDLKKYLEDNGFRVKVCGNVISRKIFETGMLKARRYAS
jgi:FkbM family methyltransferase|tara:strand:+ start:1443 stop:2219 length:777 start_codon:yes stop_codon:yes gene_type:complete